MGEQLIKVPDGTFAVWSTDIDDILVYGFESAHEFATWRADRERDREYLRALKEAEFVSNGYADDSYTPAWKWEEMQVFWTLRHGKPWKPSSDLQAD